MTALERLRQEDCKFEACVGCIVKPYSIKPLRTNIGAEYFLLIPNKIDDCFRLNVPLFFLKAQLSILGNNYM